MAVPRLAKRRPSRRRTTLARTWADAVAGTSVVPMNRRALVAFLPTSPRTSSRPSPPRPSTARCRCASAAALVDAHFTETASIERTLALLGCELAAPTPAAAERLGLAAGRRRGRLRPGAAGPHPARAGATERRRLRGAGRRGAGALGQRGPVPDGLRRGGDRHRAGRHRGAGPRGQPGAGRDARPQPESALRGCDDLDVRPPRRRAGAVGPDQGAARRRARPAAGGEGLPTARTAPRCGPTSCSRSIRDPHGAPQYMVAMVENITERHRLQTRLRHQALHDPLTGLPNRTLFFDRLDAALRRPGTAAGRLLPRPRRVQGGQRHPRPRQGRRPAADRGAPR